MEETRFVLNDPVDYSRITIWTKKDMLSLELYEILQKNVLQILFHRGLQIIGAF